MYFCTVTGNSRVMICTLSSAHWQQASKHSACSALSRFGKIEINAPINRIIRLMMIIRLMSEVKCWPLQTRC